MAMWANNWESLVSLYKSTAIAREISLAGNNLFGSNKTIFLILFLPIYRLRSKAYNRINIKIKFLFIRYLKISFSGYLQITFT